MGMTHRHSWISTRGPDTHYRLSAPVQLKGTPEYLPRPNLKPSQFYTPTHTPLQPAWDMALASKERS